MFFRNKTRTLILLRHFSQCNFKIFRRRPTLVAFYSVPPSTIKRLPTALVLTWGMKSNFSPLVLYGLTYSFVKKISLILLKTLSLSEKYLAITEVESGTKPSPITITKRAVDLLKDLHGRRYLKLLNYFKIAVSLRRNRLHFTWEVI